VNVHVWEKFHPSAFIIRAGMNHLISSSTVDFLQKKRYSTTCIYWIATRSLGRNSFGTRVNTPSNLHFCLFDLDNLIVGITNNRPKSKDIFSVGEFRWQEIHHWWSFHAWEFTNQWSLELLAWKCWTRSGIVWSTWNRLGKTWILG